MEKNCVVRVVCMERHSFLKEEESSGSFASEKGATMLEAAIVFPLFFLFVLGIFDVSSVMRQQYAVAESLRSTANFVSTHKSNCRNLADLQFTQSLESSFGSGVREARLDEVSRETVSGVTGFRLNASAEYNCLFCMNSIGVPPPQSFSLFIPAESPASCPDL